MPGTRGAYRSQSLFSFCAARTYPRRRSPCFLWGSYAPPKWFQEGWAHLDTLNRMPGGPLNRPVAVLPASGPQAFGFSPADSSDYSSFAARCRRIPQPRGVDRRLILEPRSSDGRLRVEVVSGSFEHLAGASQDGAVAPTARLWFACLLASDPSHPERILLRYGVGWTQTAAKYFWHSAHPTRESSSQNREKHK